MSMKTFFTFFSFLFLGVVSSILIAGYISYDNRLTKEAYTKKMQLQLAQITTSVDDSQKKIDLLEQQFQANGLAKPATKKTTSTTAKKTTTTTTSKTTTKAPSGTVLTKTLVASHATQSDCWIIVSGKVYSVSSYIAMHPGGRSAIVNVCGKDATTSFTTRGGTGEHSSSAWSLLGQFLVGTLGATVKL